MKKKMGLLLSHLLVAVLATVLTLSMVSWQLAGNGKLAQLEALILERYVAGADPVKLEDAAADAMIAATGDRWSYYIPADEYETYLEQAANAYVGIGITIVEAEDGSGLEVVEVTAGGSAEAAGVLAGDIIIAIGDQSAAGMTTADARNLVRGEAGTTVQLTFRRDQQERVLDIQRRQIQTPVAVGRLLTKTTGLVTIENFDRRCAEETIAAMESLLEQGAENLIFDVRNNPGGFADELVKVLDYLLPEGDLFRTVDYAGRESVDTSDAAHLDIPMVVLVNEDSYSAAEFFAVALQEYGAAKIVGAHTSGKGYFQNTFELSDGSAVALSVGKYFTPKGNSLEGAGAVPDLEVPVDEETAFKIYYSQLSPEEDPQIQAALTLVEEQP